MCIFVRKPGSMEKDALKLKFLKKIMDCDNEQVLEKISVLLKDFSANLMEPDQDYELKNLKDLLSKEQIEEINKRYRLYLEGNLETESLETFNKKMFEKYGL